MAKNRAYKKPNVVKQIPIDSPTFKANGKVYSITEEISVERWRHFEDLNAMVGLGRSFNEVFENIKGAYEDLNKGKQADAAVKLHNLMTGIKSKLDGRHHPALEICALFINYDKEDTAIYDEKTQAEKITDWQTEGYDMKSFFQLAWRFVPKFIDVYNADLENILNQSLSKVTGISSTTE